MTSCCRSGPCAEMFTPRVARRDLARYRKKGLDAIERRMLASTTPADREGAHVLEIGGGVGALLAELLASGAGSGTIVELVPSYEPYARELAREKGLETRMRYVVADLLEHPAAERPAEIVLLNRVVCCSPDGVELTAVAGRLTRRTLLLSYPRDVWWIRLGVGLLNVGSRLLRRSFRVFVHAPTEILAAAESTGLRPAGGGHGAFWEFAALRRVG